MRRIPWLVTAAFVGWSMAGCGGTKDEAVTLRLRLKEGATYAFDSKVAQSTDVAGSSTKVDQSLVTTVKVDGVTEGKYLTTSSISDVNIDSKEIPEADRSRMQKELSSVKIKLEYDDLGYSTPTKSTADDKAGSMAAGMGAQGVGFMGLHYPSKPIKVGDKWEATFDLKDVLGSVMAGLKPTGETKIPIQYSLKALESRSGKSVALITFSMVGDLAFAVDNPQGKAMELKMKSTSKGEYVVDVATGIPLESSTDGQNELSVTGRSFIQKMKIDVKYRG